MKLLVTYNIPREPFQNLPADWEITFPEKEEFSKTELLRILPDYDIMLAIFHAPIDREIIDAGKKLKLISNYGVGYNNIDITYAREKGIAVTNTPKAVNSPTAELALALMLSAARRIAECNQRIRIEKESMWGTMRNLGFGLEGKTLGIIGLGNIGKNVARKAEAFGMNIIYYNHHTEVPGYRRVELDTLLRESDFVTLHTPLTPATRHLIGQRELSLMKPTAILVNTARGAVVDEQALAEVLKKRQIAGAALDSSKTNLTSQKPSTLWRTSYSPPTSEPAPSMPASPWVVKPSKTSVISWQVIQPMSSINIIVTAVRVNFSVKTILNVELFCYLFVFGIRVRGPGRFWRSSTFFYH